MSRRGLRSLLFAIPVGLAMWAALIYLITRLA